MSNEINEQEVLQWIRFAKGVNESLADILRHDEGHDKWHAMHGDSPCTSEADCAKKRAKYDEVKSEVTKGDLPGHDFHGNQYSDGGVGAAKELQSETEHFRVGMNKGEDFPSGDNHREFATAHDRLATSAPTPELRAEHEEAADLHREAAYWQDSSEEHNGHGGMVAEEADKASIEALRASKYATDSTIDSASPPTPPTPVDPNQPF
jgi:hypothetical protein